MIESVNKNTVIKTLKISFAFAISIIIVGILSIVIFNNKGGINSKDFQYIASHLSGYCIGYVFFSLLSFIVTPIMIIHALWIKTQKQTYIFDILGIVFLIPYTILATVAYGSQYWLLPYLLKYIYPDSIEIIRLTFFTSNVSIPYNLDLIGYAYLGLSSLLIGYKFFFGRWVIKSIGFLLYTSGLLSIIALILHSLQFRNAGEIVSMIGGILTLPWIIIVFVFSKPLVIESK
jgi:hypothetical protein